MKTAYLVVNGVVDEKWLSSELKDKKPVFCTDGAVDKVKVKVEAVLGDLDSVKVKECQNYVHLPDQEFTDFEKALKHLEGKYDTVIIYGASGGLVDHTLSNLSIASIFKNKMQLMFKEPKQEYIFADNNLILEKVKGKTISLVPFPMAKGVTTKGLKWPLKNETLGLGGFISARNKAELDKIEISYKDGCLLVFVEDS